MSADEVQTPEAADAVGEADGVAARSAEGKDAAARSAAQAGSARSAAQAGSARSAAQAGSARSAAQPRRRMTTRLFRSELWLIFGRRRNWVGLAVLCTVPILINVASKISDSGNGGPDFFASIT